MSEPVTINKQLVVALTGDLPGAWATAALNPNFVAIDGMMGGFQTIGITGGSLTLGTATGTTSPGAGPTQSQNALLRFTGALGSNQQVLFTLPGFYIVENLTTNNSSWYVQLCPVSGPGNCIGVPDGQKSWVFFDGTNVDFVNAPPVGSYLDLAVSTSPIWFNACSVLPYLLCNGAIYTASNFTALGIKLGSTFGGNGISTFGVPDQQGRYRAMIDGTGARITSGISGVNGQILGAAGGDQRLMGHTHSFTGTQQTWSSNQTNVNFGASPTASGAGSNIPTSLGTVTMTITPAGTIGTTGGGSSQNIPPMIIGNLTYIKT